MDYYDEKLNRSGASYKACFYCFVGMILIMVVSFFVGRCTSPKGEGGDTIRVDSVFITDTITKEIHDTLPIEKKEKVIEYVSIPCPEHTNGEDTAQVMLPIVQKEFSDDSTYTAYVSGLKYNEWPKLDSITVRQREVMNTIIKTITIKAKQSPWKIGIQAGYGYGFNYKGLEPYVGVGIGYSF